MGKTKAASKSSWGWRILRWGLIGLAGLITLIALVWVEENWRGRRAWQSYKKEWEAKGEKFDLKDFVPPPVPAEQNFAMTPFLAPLFDFNPPQQRLNHSVWRDTNGVQQVRDFGMDMGYPKSSGSWKQARRMDLTAWATALDGKKEVPASDESQSVRTTAAGTVLEKLEKYQPVLDELLAASRRPYCRFNISYDDEDPEGILLPHLAMLKTFSQIYCLRAAAEIADGRNDAALADIRMGFYFADSIRQEPVLISGLVQIALVNITLQPVWEGLADRRWTEAQLKELQQQLGKIDLLKGYEAIMRGERAFNNAVLEYQRRTGTMGNYSDVDDGNGPVTTGSQKCWAPSFWFYQNQVVINQTYQRLVLPPVDGNRHRVYLDLSTNIQARLDRELQGGFILYTIYAKLMFPAILKSEKKFANVQAGVDEAMTACALERYRLAHGQFPETLAALSPQFMEKVPTDLMTGEPLKFRRTEDGQFILYSVGWNGIDDGGKVAMGQGSTPRVDITQGDWVWKYPGK